MDTQDYSRFAGVLLGKADSETRQVFEFLLAKADAGDIRPVYSAVTLSELLQYHLDYEVETLARAEAVELLCKGWCCLHPGRLIAREAAALLSFPTAAELPTVIQSDNYWTPSVTGLFDDFDQQLAKAKREYLHEFENANRRTRRIAERGASDRAFSALLSEAAPIIAEEYGLSAADFRSSFLMLHKGKITREQASKRFFTSVSRPTAFIQVYFKKVDGERDFPRWITSSSEKIVRGFRHTVERMSAFDPETVRAHYSTAFDRLRPEIARIVLSLGSMSLSEFDVTEDNFIKLASDTRIQEIASIEVYTNIVKLYLAQNVGVYGSKAKIERGLGGDLMHALYLPHVDIWRSDARFSDVVRKASPKLTTHVCAKLSDLPSALDRAA